MGVEKTTLVETPLKENRKTNESEKSKKVQFIEPPEVKKSPKTPSANVNSAGRQIVPGLLLVNKNESKNDSYTTPTKASAASSPKETSPGSDHSTDKSSASPSSVTSNHDSGIVDSGVSARDQLNYLAQLIGFSVSYSDFPKANHTEFLSLVTLSTDPPQMSHGAGSSVDESRDHAALKALSVLSEMGLDNVKPKSSTK